MFRNIIGIGLFLYAAVMGLFFMVYYVFMNENYFNTTMIFNSFVLPTLFIGTALVSIIRYKREKKTVLFRQAFQRVFVPMFIGGFLSLASIFLFLNYLDTDAKDVLNYQFVERNKKGLQEVYLKEKKALKDSKKLEELELDYQIQMQSFSNEMVKGKDVFTFQYFITYYFPFILAFYLIISLFLSAFFRTRKS